MRIIDAILVIGSVLMGAGSGFAEDAGRGWLPESTLLKFDSPASVFTQSLPLGNGSQGAMVFGGVERGRIVLNEDTVWSGSPDPGQNRADAHKALPQIQKLLIDGKPREAQALVMKTFTCAGKGSGHGCGANVPFGCYQVLGNMHLDFGTNSEATVEGYERTLDISRAVGEIKYSKAGIKYRREMFVSGADGIMVYHLEADKSGKIGFTLSLDRPERAKSYVADDKTLLLDGWTKDGRGGDSVHFIARVKIRHSGGSLKSVGNTLVLEKADSATLLISCETSFYGKDPLAVTSSELRSVEGMDLATLRRRHLADYKSYFDRCTIELPAGEAAEETTPARRDAFSAGAYDPAFAALYFNYARYLLISSSRPGTQPANLQGLWAEEIQTPWNGDYHLDINVQMNYWGAEISGLSDCHQPLIDLVDSLQKPGAKTAKAYYNARGWVAHVITNPWGFTAPGESADWGATSSGTAWLCRHLIDHYAFNPQKVDSDRLYAILKGACQFYLDFMIKEPKHGWLVTAPSNSPEIGYIMPDGTRANTCMGPAIDMQSIRCLFEGTLGIARDLNRDQELQQKIAEALPQLAPTQIGKNGAIQEWLEDWPPQDPHHRHISHLWGLYPGHEIDLYRSPALAQAAKKTLDLRGDAGTGWSLANKMCFRARLGQGDRVMKLFRNLNRNCQQRSFGWKGGSFDNLFCAHPPFQVDGNFGGAAGLVEMLLQSYRSPAGKVEIRLLPALPTAWKSGSFHDLRARGGYKVSCAWKDGTIVSAEITAGNTGAFDLRMEKAVRRIELKAGETYSFVADKAGSLPAAPGKAGKLPAASRASLVDKRARANIFADPEWFQWGGSCVRGEDGKYNLFYARWRRDNPRGMFGWLYVSQIARAVADRPEGPYKFKDIVLKGFGEPQPERWDAVDAHNPCITRMRDPQSGRMRYYLYFIANRDDNDMQNDWWDHIINQRIGVAVADRPEGPWVRHPEPVITPPSGLLHHYLVNPGVCQLPDGRFLMVLKGRGAGNGRRAVGPMLHGWALADRPEGPFVVQNTLLFPASLPAEDPCVWVDGDVIYAAVKDWYGKIGGRPGISYVYGKMGADNQIRWTIPPDASICGRSIQWDDGKTTKLNALERPFILPPSADHPGYLFAAASTHNPFVNGSQSPRHDGKTVPLQNLPFNLCLPLVP